MWMWALLVSPIKKTKHLFIKKNPHSFPTNLACTLQPPPPASKSLPFFLRRDGMLPPSLLPSPPIPNIYAGLARRRWSTRLPVRSSPVSPPTRTDLQPSGLPESSRIVVVFSESGHPRCLRVRPPSSSPSPATGEEVERAPLVGVCLGPMSEMELRWEGSHRSSAAPVPPELYCTCAARALLLSHPKILECEN
jgi:hypothetical protein